MTPLVLLLALLARQAGPAVDAPDADGLTALMRASARGDVAAVTALVARQADVNLQAEGTRISALMCAAYFGRTEVITTAARPRRQARSQGRDRAPAPPTGPAPAAATPPAMCSPRPARSSTRS